MKYRKKSALIEATQWLQNGDHPQDDSEPIPGSGEPPELSEGKIVQHFRSLDAVESMDALNVLESGNQYCPHCGNIMKKHGVVDGAKGQQYVCPGDYIITARNGTYYRMSRGEFESQYEIYVRAPSHAQELPISDIEERRRRPKVREAPREY